MKPEYEIFNTSDHTEIVGRFFKPASDIKGAVIIACAMGATQRYYAPLANWLSKNSFLVVTFDYRGTGKSQKESLRKVKADLFDLVKDCSTVLNNLSMRAQNKPIYWIGHSFGGQIFPFVESIEIVSKVILVGSGSGYWLESPWSLRRKSWWLWYVIVPITLPIFGYFPGKRLRKVGNLPKGVMTQWRRWCLNPNYCVGAEGIKAREKFAAIQNPIFSLSSVDDEIFSKKSTESLHSFLTHAPLKATRITPKEIGASRIGHFGFFKEKFKQSLWEQYLLVELNNL